MREPRKEDWASDDARRQNARVSGGQTRLNLIEDLSLDDRRNRNLDDFVLGFGSAGLGLALIEAPAADINGIGLARDNQDENPATIGMRSASLWA